VFLNAKVVDTCLCSRTKPQQLYFVRLKLKALGE